MEPNTDTNQIVLERLNDIAKQLKRVNQKSDHIILKLSDDYYRRFYELYGRHFEG